MPVTVSLPDEILASDSEDVSRKVLEQVALEGFRSGQLTTAQVRRILGFDSRLQAHQFLANHGIAWVDYDEEELRRELETLGNLAPFCPGAPSTEANKLLSFPLGGTVLP